MRWGDLMNAFAMGLMMFILWVYLYYEILGER